MAHLAGEEEEEERGRRSPPCARVPPSFPRPSLQVYYTPFVQRMFTDYDAAKKAKDAGNAAKK